MGYNKPVFEFKGHTPVSGMHFSSETELETEETLCKFKQNLHLLFILNQLTSNLVSTQAKINIINDEDLFNEVQYTPNIKAGKLLDDWNLETFCL
jgi:hypothetical protein